MEAIIIVLMIVALALAVAMFVKMENEIKSLKEEIDGAKHLINLNAKAITLIANPKRDKRAVTEQDFDHWKTYVVDQIRRIRDRLDSLDRIIGVNTEREEEKTND